MNIQFCHLPRILPSCELREGGGSDGQTEEEVKQPRQRQLDQEVDFHLNGQDFVAIIEICQK